MVNLKIPAIINTMDIIIEVVIIISKVTINIVMVILVKHIIQAIINGLMAFVSTNQVITIPYHFSLGCLHLCSTSLLVFCLLFFLQIQKVQAAMHSNEGSTINTMIDQVYRQHL